jgi:hypothetical protein
MGQLRLLQQGPQESSVSCRQPRARVPALRLRRSWERIQATESLDPPQSVSIVYEDCGVSFEQEGHFEQHQKESCPDLSRPIMSV